MSEKIEPKIALVFELEDPIELKVDGELKIIETLELIKPRAKHMRALPSEPKIGDILDMAGKLARQPRHVMDELSGKDVNRLAEELEAFF